MLTARAPALSRSPSTLGRYDIVFLPPSFPIVAMENPCLTFIISSILESDEFLIIDVIHEVAHSWFGNAVTNATWEEMWLSEGLATYAQRRITTETYGTARAGAGAAGPPPGPSGHCVRGWEPSLAPGEQPPCRACVQPGWPGVISTRLRAGSRKGSSLTPAPSRCCLHLSGDSLPPGRPAQADEGPRRGQPSQQAAGQAGARYPLPPALPRALDTSSCRASLPSPG